MTEIQLVRYEAARKALADAKRVDEVKMVHDQASAMRAYAKLAKDEKLLADATEIKLRAQRRIGELMADQAKTVGKAKGGQHGGKRRKIDGLRGNPSNAPPSLAEAGIGKSLAHSARAMASLTEPQFEKAVAEKRIRIRVPMPKRAKPKPNTKRQRAPASDCEVMAPPAEVAVDMFLFRSRTAIDYATAPDAPVTPQMVAAAQAVVNRWSELKQEMESRLWQQKDDAA